MDLCLGSPRKAAFHVTLQMVQMVLAVPAPRALHSPFCRHGDLARPPHDTPFQLALPCCSRADTLLKYVPGLTTLRANTGASSAPSSASSGHSLPLPTPCSYQLCSNATSSRRSPDCHPSTHPLKTAALWCVLGSTLLPGCGPVAEGNSTKKGKLPCWWGGSTQLRGHPAFLVL